MYGKYSMFNMMKEFQENKELILAKLKNQPIECYTDNNNNNNNKNKNKNDDNDQIMGLSVWLFILLLIINTFLWIWALVVLIKFWSILPSWAQVIGILSILGLGGPIVTLIVVYIGKNNGKTSQFY